MSLEQALQDQVRDLKDKAKGIKYNIDQWKAKRDGAQEVVDREQERFNDVLALIKYLEASALEASAPLNEWKCGDRFEWVDETSHNRGTVKGISRSDNGEYIEYYVITDAGGTLKMGSEFETAARKVES